MKKTWIATLAILLVSTTSMAGPRKTGSSHTRNAGKVDSARLVDGFGLKQEEADLVRKAIDNRVITEANLSAILDSDKVDAALKKNLVSNLSAMEANKAGRTSSTAEMAKVDNSVKSLAAAASAIVGGAEYSQTKLKDISASLINFYNKGDSSDVAVTALSVEVKNIINEGGKKEILTDSQDALEEFSRACKNG